MDNHDDDDNLNLVQTISLVPTEGGTLDYEQYNIVVTFVETLDTAGLSRFLNDETYIKPLLHSFTHRSGNYKDDYFALFCATQVEKRDKNLLKKMLTVLEKKDRLSPSTASRSADIKTMTNFLLTSDKRLSFHPYANGGGYIAKERLVSLNKCDSVDGRSALHTLAEMKSLKPEHFKAFIEGCRMAGDVPDLAVPTLDGKHPLGIAFEKGNTNFLQYFDIPDDISTAAGEAHAECRAVKREIADALLEISKTLEKLIMKCV